ncbi:DUF4476 domain-containing protein [Longitalea arenae]|uniref:DUF4476 domain-containing protein n=1 Tax=Longitalea arenae TaxID=2812558 RepID=UPI0019687B47|nr:DUF4476 domain-containing protein [Longitalea arenae]
MKKTCLQILLVLLAFTAVARDGANDGIISITSLSPADMLFEVDGRQYPFNNNSLTLRNITAGYHQVKVYVKKPKTLPGPQTMIYSKNVYVKPKYYVDIVINRFNRALIDEQQIVDNRYDTDDRNNQNNATVPNIKDPRYNNFPRNNNNTAPRAIDDVTFASFMETIKHESFDDSRMAIARSGIDQNYFTAAQAKQLISLFSFESSKLEIAKYMYGKITDPKNYFIVYNAFTFSKSKEELGEYIRNYK